jgi:sRNA-binding carbon storage regulator CsrA
VLKRGSGEKIILTLPDGSEIEIMVTDTGHGWARIGIAADEGVRIWREEIAPGRRERRLA